MKSEIEPRSGARRVGDGELLQTASVSTHRGCFCSVRKGQRMSVIADHSSEQQPRWLPSGLQPHRSLKLPERHPMLAECNKSCKPHPSVGKAPPRSTDYT